MIENVGAEIKYHGFRCRDCIFFERGDVKRFGRCKCRFAKRYNWVVPAVLFACDSHRLSHQMNQR